MFLESIVYDQRKKYALCIEIQALVITNNRVDRNPYYAIVYELNSQKCILLTSTGLWAHSALLRSRTDGQQPKSNDCSVVRLGSRLTRARLDAMVRLQDFRNVM
jgi:hypothetical protein